MRLLRCLFLILLLAAGSLFGQTLEWFVNEEPRPFGTDGDMPGFVTGDTVNIRVHSNGQIAISGSPVFYEQVTTAAEDFYHGPDYNPIFLGPPPVFNVFLEVNDITASNVREHASHYESPGSDKQQRLVISQSTCRLYTWDLGVAFDSLEATFTTFPVGPSMCFFTEAPLELKGTDITGKITIGSAHKIRLMGDVRVGGPTSGPPQYRVSATNPNYVGIVSEDDIKIADVPENGYENSNGLGFEQMDPALTDIVITAFVAALGSFTFENQNDADSGYVCDCSPDFRGRVFLYGAITENSRGFHRRSNNGGTGYRLQCSYDYRFLRQRPPCFFSEGGLSFYTDPDTLNFGDAPLDTTLWDTVDVYVDEYGALGFVSAPQPFHAVQIPPSYGLHFRVPVSFSPHYATQYWSTLQVLTSYHTFEVPLRGRGVAGGNPDVTGPEAYPNPFNASTVFTFSLPSGGHATLQLYDITGRKAATLADDFLPAGTHRISFDARELPSGLYVARLETAQTVRVAKILLVK